jgi:hypothetical protein
VGEAVILLRYQPEDLESSRQVKEALERSVSAAERWGRILEPVVVTIHPTHQALEAAAHREGFPWLRAWARRASVDLQSPRTWSRGSASDAGMTQILAHELTHCVMYQWAALDRSGSNRGIPVWFREGMASVTAGQEHRLTSSNAGWRSPEKGDPLAAPEGLLKSDSALVYATAHRAFHFLLDSYGEERIRRLLAGMGDGREFPEAFQSAVGISVEDFEGDFKRHAPRDG